MSDEDVINSFRGDKYEADGSFQCEDPTKADWFPPKGMKLTVDFKPGSKTEAKIKLELAPGTAYKGKKAIEEASYIVKGDDLVNANPLRLELSLTANETLVMGADPNKPRDMLHLVEFSDKIKGKWTCPDKS